MNELTTIQVQGNLVSTAIESLVNQVLKNADDGLEPTTDQINAVISFHKSAQNADRASVYWYRQKRVHLKLGYASFEEFGKKMFDYESGHLHRLARAFEIEQDLNCPMGQSQIPERQLRPLSKVEPELRAEVWQEAIDRALAEGKKIGAKHVEEVVTEYIAKNQALQKRLDWIESDNEAINKQNDQLRNDLALKVNEKVFEKLAIERATLILENSNALQNAQKLIDDAQDTIERLQQESAEQLERFKKEKDKAIKDGISLEINKRETEIRQLDYQVESLQKQAAELRAARDLLDTENGTIKQHQESIKDINSAIQTIKSALYLADESGNTPVELIQAWNALSLAMAELANQLSLFCNRGVGSVVINGNLLSADTNDDFGVDTFNNWGNA